MKKLNKSISVLLVLCMLIPLCGVSAFAAGNASSGEFFSWDNGAPNWTVGTYYTVGAPLSYEYYYLGVIAETPARAKGFYPMTMATAGDYTGRYTADASGGTAPINSDIYQSFIHGPYMRASMHYANAVVFTAPVAGDVTFNYWYYSNPNQDKVNCSLQIARSNYIGGWTTADCQNVLVQHDVDAIHTPTAGTLTLTVAAGEKIYFINHADTNKDYDSLFFWLEKISYGQQEKPVEPEVGEGVWDHGELSFAYGQESNTGYTYPDTTPIRYVYYNKSSHDADLTSSGEDIPAGFYDAVYDSATGKWGYDPAIHTGIDVGQIKGMGGRGVSFTAAMHWLPGLAFTAPKAGTLEFTVQAAGLQKPSADGILSIVTVLEGADFAQGWGGVSATQSGVSYLHRIKTTADESGNSNTDAPQTKTYTVTVNVTAGQDVYFLVDGGTNISWDEVSLWIQKVKYVDNPSGGGDTPSDGGSDGVSWNNGNLTVEWNDANKNYVYPESFPVRYVYYSRGTHADDKGADGNPIGQGFYDAVQKASGAWGYDPAIHTQINAAEINGFYGKGTMFLPEMHWMPGLAFTAPRAGEIEFTLQVKANASNSTDGILSVVTALEGAGFKVGWGDVTASSNYAYNFKLKDTADESGASNKDGNKLQTYTVRVNVVKGQEVYFLVNGGSNISWDETLLFIQKAEYISVAPSAAGVIGRGLAAEDRLRVRILIQSDTKGAPAASFTIGGKAVEVADAVQFIDEEGASGRVITAEDNVWAYTVNLTAKQVTETIGISVKNADGAEILPKEDQTYTVEEYCQYWIDQYAADGSNEDVARTCASILFYGRMTQMQFNYRLEDLPKLDETALALLDLSQTAGE